MDRLLLVGAAALAAMVIPTGPAAAHWSDADFGAAASVTVHRSSPSAADGSALVGRVDGDRDRRHRHGRRGHDRFGDGTVGGVFAYDYGFDTNRSWDSDSFNDWWHDRPDRAFPRWVQNNQNCTPDRMWWSGSGWHC
jgi:hypothetical protein